MASPATFEWNIPLTNAKMITGKDVPEEIIVPAGTYYIGDPCYPLGDSPLYEDVWADAVYATPAVYRSAKGILFIDSTAYGDGAYKGSDGHEYGVDAGVLSIISKELIQEWLTSQGSSAQVEDTIASGKLHTFLHPVRCIFGDGEFEIQDMKGNDLLRINTRDEDDEDQDQDDPESEEMEDPETRS